MTPRGVVPRALLLLPLLLVGLASPAAAQWERGVRAGVSSDPDQFFFGGHLESAPLAEHVTFRPNVEVGLGDHLTLVAFNIEFAYSIPLDREPWRVYLGGGPAANLYTVHTTRGLVGAQHARGLFTELKVGAIDSPTLKFTVGYTFGRR